MRLHANSTPADVIDYVRDRAIANHEPTPVLDGIEKLSEMQDLEADLEEAEERAGEAEQYVRDLREELRNLCKAIPDPATWKAPNKRLSECLQSARDAIKRHET